MQTQIESSTEPKARTKASEGRTAKAIESVTARIPSDLYLWAAGAAMTGSLVAQILGVGGGRKSPSRAPLSMFIGQWVPTLLLFGVYNKLVKQHGSDREQE